ncbi:hypothetical protein Bca4012_014633 [Brassica carinata]
MRFPVPFEALYELAYSTAHKYSKQNSSSLLSSSPLIIRFDLGRENPSAKLLDSSARRKSVTPSLSSQALFPFSLSPRWVRSLVFYNSTVRIDCVLG